MNRKLTGTLALSLAAATAACISGESPMTGGARQPEQDSLVDRGRPLPPGARSETEEGMVQAPPPTTITASPVDATP
jgi:hypothetical protein